MRFSVAVAVSCITAIGFAAAADVQAAIRKSTNIPAQGLGPALQMLAKDRGFQVVYVSDEVNSLHTQGATGELTSDEALIQLLNGTGLTYRYFGENAVGIISSVRPESSPGGRDAARHERTSSRDAGDGLWNRLRFAQLDTEASPSSSAPASERSDDTKSRIELEEVTVTGTYIHNADPVSPVIRLAREELQRQGYTTLQQAVEQLPQHFKGGASVESNPLNGAGNGASTNYSFASGVNLRGLGAGATLVLLNGRRLAPTARGGVTDISQIPLGIIDRIEILPDGASSLYGSDAVAGVVNVITRQDYDGAEVNVRATGMSEGKQANYGGYVLGGLSWASGGLAIGIDYQKDDPLPARNRPFAGSFINPFMLTPDNKSTSYYATLHNELGERADIQADTLISRRTYFIENQGPTDPVPSQNFGDINQDSVGLQFDYQLGNEWKATLLGQYSKEDDDNGFVRPTFLNPFDVKYRVATAESRADGRLFEIGGGAVRLALGGQFRTEEYRNRSMIVPLSPGAPSVPPRNEKTDRDVQSLYGELLLPFITDQNSLALAQRLQLSVSGRYDDYSDFGGTFNPKVAMEWAPTADLSVHASYSESFKAPTLFSLSKVQLFAYVLRVPDPLSATGTSLVVLVDGTNPNLGPESSKNWSFGVTYEPSFLPGWKANASFFSIDFSDQINRLALQGYFTNVLQREAELGSLVQRDPSAAEVNDILQSQGRTVSNFVGAFSPADVEAVAHIDYQNTSSVEVQGIDLAIQYAGAQTRFGRWFGDVAASYYLDYQQRVTPGAPDVTVTNRVFNPLRFRGKANLGWAFQRWSVNARMNYANAYDNTVDPSCTGAVLGACEIRAWTTVDLSLSYANSGYRISLDAMNLLNRKPPFVANHPTPQAINTPQYDAANANPFLRTVGISVTKAWGRAR